MEKKTLLDLKPIKKLIDGIGKDVKKYLGQGPGCIVGLGDDGFFYGLGLYQWLQKSNKNLTFADMDDEGKELDEKSVAGRKVLLVDNDIVTGKGYKKAMEAMRERKERLKIKDIKFAVLCDRAGLADFSVEGYSAFGPWSLNILDGLDLKIIRDLSKDGRKSFVDIAKETKLSPVGIKNRVEKLIEQNVLKIQGGLNVGKFYSVSAHIEIEADGNAISRLVEKFKKSPLVYHLVRISGRYNLLVGIASPNLENIELFISKEIRGEPGVKHIDVAVGELPAIPEFWTPPLES